MGMELNASKAEKLRGQKKLNDEYTTTSVNPAYDSVLCYDYECGGAGWACGSRF